MTFGHDFFVKGLSSYVGMTANCILLQVDDEVLQYTNKQQLDHIDTELAKLFTVGESYTKPKDLSPFPLLGLPDWDKDNEQESYYDNLNYFRSGRSK